MQIQRRRLLKAFSVSCLFIALSACGPKAYRVHPEIETYTKNIKTVALAPPNIKIFALTAGGVQELRDDWSEQGKQNVIKAVVDHFKDEKVPVKVVTVPKPVEQEMEEIHSLYRAVSGSIIVHTYYPQYTFPEKKEHFEYSIGSIEKILDSTGANALIIIYGDDEISTGGRKFMTAITSPLSLITGMKPRSGITDMSIALVDKSGRVLWYNIGGKEGGYDLRKPGSAAGFVNEVLAGFPELKK